MNVYLCSSFKKFIEMEIQKKQVKLHDKTFELYIKKEKIDAAIKAIGQQMNKELKDDNPLFIVVLNGAFVFAADLLREFDYDCDITFVKLSSYVGTKTTHAVRELIGLDTSVKGRTVVLIEDIIDTGITMHHVINLMKKMEAKKVKVATMLFKPNALKKEISIDYKGMEIPNDFIVGCGLDYDGKGRNLPDIYQVVS